VVDIEADLDAAEFRWIEPNLETILPRERLAGDFNCQPGQRDRCWLRCCRR